MRSALRRFSKLGSGPLRHPPRMIRRPVTQPISFLPSIRASLHWQSRAGFVTASTCRYVAKQSCLVCGRKPCDAHHLRFAQSRALGRKVSDEFTVPLCRGHHRELHRHGDEAAWWRKAAIDPAAAARSLWLETHPRLAEANSAGSAGSRRGRSGRKTSELRNEANLTVDPS